MLSPAQLERASGAFRRGYNDAWNGVNNSGDYTPGTFGHNDYIEGQEAYTDAHGRWRWLPKTESQGSS